MSVQSFSAVCNEHCYTLILGSMPGVASLNAVQYYAHKRNAFWPIMLAIIEQCSPSFEHTAKVDYQDRIALLNKHGFGVWDVLAECERQGSLDSAIQKNSVVINNFQQLLATYTQIRQIAFNGKAAENLFKRHAKPQLLEDGIDVSHIKWISLPSSSPAMASLNLQRKFEHWQNALLPTHLNPF